MAEVSQPRVRKTEEFPRARIAAEDRCGELGETVEAVSHGRRGEDKPDPRNTDGRPRSNSPSEGVLGADTIVDCRTRGKSVFHFNVPGSVAHSTHAGLPWLLRIREARPDVHFWPFDGWLPPAGRSVIAEVYPALFSDQDPPEGLTNDQRDAWRVAKAFREADFGGELPGWFAPKLPPEKRKIAEREGWMLGVANRAPESVVRETEP
jgi:hypothetical protein